MSLPPLVGRDQAVLELGSAIDRARRGRGGVVLVTGEPGIGKTRLVREVVEPAHGGVAVGWGAGGLLGAGGPFGPWIQALRSLGDERAVAVVSRMVAGDVPDLLVPVEGRELARLQLFDEVAAGLQVAAGKQPVVLVLDDLHLADVSSLALLAFLVAPLHTSACLVVATASLDDLSTGPDGRAVLRTLARQAQQVGLGPLDVAATATLVEALTGRRWPDEVVATLWDRTAGNPLFVVDLVQLLDARGELDGVELGAREAVPDSVRGVVGRWIRHLPESGQVLLSVAATFGTVAATDLLMRAAGELVGELAAQQALREVEDAHLLVVGPGGTHRFTHGLYREALHGSLAPPRRRELHAVVAAVLERARAAGHDVSDAQIAAHLMATGDPSVRRRAVAHLRAAAVEAAGVHAHEDASRHLRAALEVARRDPGSEALQAEVLLDLGDAAVAAGDLPASRAAFEQAAHHARAAGEPVLLARAAIGVGSGEAGFEVPLLDDRQITLLEQALAALPASEAAWAARLQARLSVAASFTEAEAGRVALCEAAIATAREVGDIGALASGLAAHCDALAGPADCELRESQASEVLRIARDRGDLRTELLGRRLRVVARLEQGDLSGARVDMDAFEAVASRLDEPLFSWYPPLWRAMRLQLAGRSDDASRATDLAADIGERAHSVNAAQLADTQRYWLAIDTGDVDALRSMREAFDDLPPATWARVAFARAHAALGTTEAARVLLDRVADELPDAPLDSEWLPMLGQVAETIQLVGPHPLAAWTHAALLPHRTRHIVEGIGAVMRGSVERPLGTLAATLGDHPAAQTHLDAALAANRRLGGAALVARTLYDAGMALGSADRLEAAAALYGELGWHRRVAQIREQRTGQPTIPAGPTVRTADPATSHGTFRRDGDGWELGWLGESVRLRDAKGLHDLAWLLARPGVETPALDLLTASGAERAARHADHDGHGPEGDLGEVLDARARDAYRRRLVELEQDIADATSDGDLGRRERDEAERDALVGELAAAYGLGGRVRRAGDPAERARTTVTSRIRYAIDRVAAVHPELGQHLANSVRTGRFCAYTPERAVIWAL